MCRKVKEERLEMETMGQENIGDEKADNLIPLEKEPLPDTRFIYLGYKEIPQYGHPQAEAPITMSTSEILNMSF
ncbi:hypothetical protein AV530_006109 [Patagioenas fasciata monilis]|uniref:Uncharacterized protein n=1 Tax=Patagioenas fasciata monilis TaxID=372326 RepID=A0A1V4J8C7_PATFA|nr:hypothetical protein AV530_006109 [Patagioenas fasciata monilis]